MISFSFEKRLACDFTGFLCSEKVSIDMFLINFVMVRHRHLGMSGFDW
jgi:hypothetical protein